MPDPAINFKNLVKTAPFSRETKQKILANLAKLSDSQKSKLVKVAWAGLAQQYAVKTKHELDKLKLAVQKGEREFKKEDFEGVEQKVAAEFAKKLNTAQSQQSISAVRQELKKHLQASTTKKPTPRPTGPTNQSTSLPTPAKAAPKQNTNLNQPAPADPPQTKTTTSKNQPPTEQASTRQPQS